jgi:putative ABC transport system ATP-binding protein
MTTTATLIGTTSAVSLRGVTRVYGSGPDAVRAVDDVHLDFPRGGWTAVMGPSGSGKSTLLHCAAGLERVDAGRVLLGDTDITAAGDAELTALRRLDPAWTVLGALTVTAFAVTGLTSLITSWSGTRPAPVSMLGTRE